MSLLGFSSWSFENKKDTSDCVLEILFIIYDFFSLDNSCW